MVWEILICSETDLVKLWLDHDVKIQLGHKDLFLCKIVTDYFGADQS
jgi:hypothetical protein